MIQKIFLIMVVIEGTRSGPGFSSYVGEHIDLDIKDFIPERIELLECKLFPDFYIDNIIDKAHGLSSPERVVLPDHLTFKKEVMELTFLSDQDLVFRQLPWLENYVNETAEDYDKLAVIYPYLIKDGNGYSFRLPYKMITPVTNEDSTTNTIKEDYSLLQINAD